MAKNGINCAVGSLDTSKEMDKIRGWFPNKSDNFLGDALEAWRAERKGRDGKYPSKKQVLDNFLKRWREKRLRTTESTKTKDQVLDQHKALHKDYNQAQLKHRSIMIADDFTQVIDDMISEHPGMSRSTAIFMSGGIMGILHTIRDGYACCNYETLKKYNDENIEYNKEHPDKPCKTHTDEELHYRADEFAKMVKNFDMLVLRASPYIKLNENVNIDIKSLEENLEKMKELEELENKEDNWVPERYNLNYKMLMPHETLSTETRKIISNIPMLDDEGNRITDDMGMDIYFDPLQILGVLTRIGGESMNEVVRVEEDGVVREVSHFIRNLELNSDEYPWMNSILEELKKDDQARTTLTNDVLKAKVYYMGVYVDKEGNYRPSLKNTRAARGALVRETNHTLMDGITLNNATSIYNEKKRIGRPSSISEGREKDSEFFRACQEELDTMMKAYDDYIAQPMKDDKGHRLRKWEKSGKWADEHKEDVENLTAYLRGVGFDVSVKDVVKAAKTRNYAQEMARKRKKNGYSRSTENIHKIISSLVNIYKGASLSYGGSTADFYADNSTDKYINIQDSYEFIGANMSSAILDDVEARARVKDSIYSTYVTPNLVDQVFKSIVINYTEKSKNDFLAWMMDEFGTEGNLDYNGRLTGWLGEIYDRVEERSEEKAGLEDSLGVFDIINFADFDNNQVYGEMSPRDKFIAAHALATKKNVLGLYTLEAPIASDYDTDIFVLQKLIVPENYRNPLTTHNADGSVTYDLENPAVLALTDEVLCEIRTIERAKKRNAENDAAIARGDAPIYPEFGPATEGLTKFQIFPEFNSEGIYDAYIEERNGGRGDAALNIVKTAVARQLEDIVQKEIEHARELGVFDVEQFDNYFVNEQRRAEELRIKLYDTEKQKQKKLEAKERYEREDVVLPNGTKMTRDGFIDMQNFAINSMYGRQQISKILGINRAWFVSSAEMQKRQHAEHAPGTPLDVTATWNGERVGKEYGTVVYMGDSVQESAYVDEVSNIYDSLIGHGITKDMKENFLKEFKKIKETDGQTFRTLESMRAVRIMKGGGSWNNECEAAYQRIMANSFKNMEQKKRDMSLMIAQNLKPVTTGYEKVRLADGSVVRVLIEHKCSEAVLLPAHMYEGSFMKSPYLAALSRAAKERNVDAFVYNSSCKIGCFDYISSPSEYEKDSDGNPVGMKFKTAGEMCKHIVDAIDASPYSIHQIPFKYYRIAASMDPHIYDQVRAHSSQQEKTVFADISRTEEAVIVAEERDKKTGEVTRGEVKMKSRKAKKFYYQLSTAIVAKAYEDLVDLFEDADKLERVLREELGTKEYNSPEVLEMLTLLKDGNFVIPPFNPTTGRIAQQLLMSIIRKRLTRPTSKGGSIIAQSAVGVDKMRFEYNDDMSDEDKVSVVFDEVDGKKRVKYFEIIIPLHDNRLRQFADTDGEIKPAKLRQLVEDGTIPESMLNCILFRSPSDAAHSTIPCRIKGFKSNVAGASIVAPKELMVALGQDNDGDKALMHFKDFDVDYEYDKDAMQTAYDQFTTRFPMEKITYEQYVHRMKDIYGHMNEDGVFERFVTTEAMWMGVTEDDNFSMKEAKDTFDSLDGELKKQMQEKFDHYMNLAKTFKPKTKFVENKFDWTMDKDGNLVNDPVYQDNKAINNALVDIVFGIQTSPEGTARMLMPGGFEEMKVPCKAIQIVKRTKAAKNRLREMRDKLQEQYNNETNDNERERLARAIKSINEDIESIKVPDDFKKFKNLLKKDSDALAERLTAYEDEDSPYTNYNHVKAYNNIMGGARIIPSAALWNSAIDHLQGSNIFAKTKRRDENGEMKDVYVYLFGHRLHDMFNVFTKGGDDFKWKGNHFVSRLMSLVINAGVDNGKDPILGECNINDDTIDFMAAMGAAGYDIDDILLFINHPAFIRAVELKRSLGFDGTLKKAAGMLKREINNRYDEGQRISNIGAIYELKDMDEDDFVSVLGESYEDITGDKDMDKEVMGVLTFIQYLDDVANDTKDLIRLIRPDTSSGSVAQTVGGQIEKIRRLRNFIDRYENGELTIGVNPELMDMIREQDIEEGMETETIAHQFDNAFEPRTAALNTLSQRKSMDMMRRFFPQANETWVDTIIDTYEYCFHNAKYHKATLFDQMINELITFMMSKNTKLLGDLEKDRIRYINTTPLKLRDLKEKIKEIKERRDAGKEITKDEKILVDNIFLKRLYLEEPNNMNDFSRINFEVGGSINSTITENIRQSWGELLNNGDPKVVQLAKDLFMYNLFSDGFGFGQYTFSQFAPLSVMLSVPEYSDALNALLQTDVSPVDKQRFALQYGCNHHYNRRVAPQLDLKDIRSSIDYTNIDDPNRNGVAFISMKPGFNLAPGFYTINGSLYNYRRTTTGGEFQEYPMIGYMKKRNQFFIKYNPFVDAIDMKPLLIPPKGWGHLEGLQAEADAYMAEMAGDYTPLSEPLIKPKPVSNPLEQSTVPTPRPVKSTDTDKKPATNNNIRENASKADGKNDKKLGDTSATTNTQAAQSEQTASVQESEHSSFPLDESGRADFSKMSTNQITVYMSQHPEEEMRLAAYLTGKMNTMLSLATRAVDESGNEVSVIEEVPATPSNVARARKQRAYITLDSKLRAILNKVNISVGFLDELEERVGMNGITDFDKARVAGEGMIELIRLSHGEAGQHAFPEEFAHAALAMLSRDHPLVSRLIDSLCRDQQALRDAYEGQYDQYAEAYNNNLEKLAYEAAGKLVAKHLLDQEMKGYGTQKSLISRIVDKIKSLLRKISGKEVRWAILSSDDMASEIAKGFLEGNLADELSIQNIGDSTDFSRSVTLINNNSGILDKLLKRSMSNLKLYERRMAYAKNKEHKVVDSVKATIASLNNGIKYGKIDLALSKYIEQTMQTIAASEATLMKVIDAGASHDIVCRKLNSIRDIIYGYSMSLSDIEDYIAENRSVGTDVLKQSLDSATSMMNAFNAKYNKIAMEYFEVFIRKYYGDSITIPMGRYKGRIITVEEMARYAPSDISMASRWLDCLTDSKDLINKVFDENVNRAKFTARALTLDLERRIGVAIGDLERATGSRDTSFMFKRDEDGKRTGRYLNKLEAKVELNAAQLKYYEFFIEEKKKLDSYLPSIITNSIYNTIKVRDKSFKTAKKNHDKGWFRFQLDKLESALLDTSDDVMYDVDEVLVDFQGNRVDMLPIKYCRLGKNETEEDMIDDTASSLLVYASMANNYNCLNSIIGELENARYMSRERDVQQKSGSRRQLETIADERHSFQRPLTKKQAVTNLGAMLDDFFSMHVYGHMTKDEGTFGKTRVIKMGLAKFLNTITSWSTMAANPINRMSNVGEGLVQVFTEMAGDEFYDVKGVRWANKTYRKELADMIAKMGMGDNNDNKLRLWCKMLDIQQENDREFEHKNYKDKGFRKVVGKLSPSTIAYAGLTAGEHYLSCANSLAAADKIRLLDAEGNNINIYDAYEVAYADKENKRAPYLKLKDGVTTLDHKKFGEKEGFDLAYTASKRSAGINFRNNGIYNRNNAPAVGSVWYGALFELYRKWFKPALVRRYGATTYNNLTESWNEGYWNTTFRFFGAVLGDISHIGTAMRVNWENLNEQEKANLKKGAMEMGILAGVLIALALLTMLDASGDDDDDDLNWFQKIGFNTKLLILLLYKMKNMILSLSPTPQAGDEILKIFGSPFASLDMLRRAWKAFGIIFPWNWTESSRIKQGRYKGMKKGTKLILNAPVISMSKNFLNLLDPDSLIDYYER